MKPYKKQGKQPGAGAGRGAKNGVGGTKRGGKMLLKAKVNVVRATRRMTNAAAGANRDQEIDNLLEVSNLVLTPRQKKTVGPPKEKSPPKKTPPPRKAASTSPIKRRMSKNNLKEQIGKLKVTASLAVLAIFGF